LMVFEVVVGWAVIEISIGAGGWKRDSVMVRVSTILRRERVITRKIEGAIEGVLRSRTLFVLFLKRLD